MKKLTAVEWLAQQMQHPQIFNPYIQQAKELEKEQIVDAYIDASPRFEDITKEAAQDYYNETFNQPES